MKLGKTALSLILSLGILSGCSLSHSNDGTQPTTTAVVTDNSVTVADTAETVSNADNKLASNVNMVSNSVSVPSGDEEARKAEYGEFYVPLPTEVKQKDDVEVRGLYLNPDVAAMDFSQENIDTYIAYIEGLKNGEAANEEAYNHINPLEKALAMCQSTDLNTLVIDIKTDHGDIAWKSDIEIVNRLGSSTSFSSDDYVGLLKYMKEHGIHSMARIVVFKDPVLSNAEPEHAITTKDGEVFLDYAKQSWLNPFDDYVWKYTVAVSKEAALRGFDEIHFDYVRFPENAADYNDKIDLPFREGRPKDEAITEFLKYAQKELEPYGVKTGAAIFGTTTTSWDDVPEDIGQTWRKITGYVDRVSPMVYPSHYSEGWFGIQVPDTEPYKFLHGATMESLQRNSLVHTPGAYTPWIQAFTATWIDGHIEYTPEVIHEQIKAIQEFGLNSYLMWNASGEYLPQPYIQPRIESTIAEGQDIVGRTVSDAIELYFKTLTTEKDERDNTMLYMLTPIDERPYDYQMFKYNYVNSEVNIKSYTFDNTSQEPVQKVTITMVNAAGETEEKEIEVRVILESGMYKVSVPKDFIDFNAEM